MVAHPRSSAIFWERPASCTSMAESTLCTFSGDTGFPLSVRPDATAAGGGRCPVGFAGGLRSRFGGAAAEAWGAVKLPLEATFTASSSPAFAFAAAVEVAGGAEPAFFGGAR